jgi:putative endonuclease
MLSLIYRAADALRRSSLGADHGRLGEDFAHRYLRSRGCTVVARNYRPPSGHGEIDLVVWHQEKLVFVEVKTRGTAEFGEPDRAVDANKRQYLARAARDYARRAGVEWPHVRFDIVAVILAPRRIEWLRDAFH